MAKQSVRQCCVCRTRSPQHELIRLQSGKYGTGSAFKDGGRSIYVCQTVTCISSLEHRLKKCTSLEVQRGVFRITTPQSLDVPAILGTLADNRIALLQGERN
jgi:predicted RNA-binding protein YlxR (DUF448 family)